MVQLKNKQRMCTGNVLEDIKITKKYMKRNLTKFIKTQGDITSDTVEWLLWER